MQAHCSLYPWAARIQVAETAKKEDICKLRKSERKKEERKRERKRDVGKCNTLHLLSLKCARPYLNSFRTCCLWTVFSWRFFSLPIFSLLSSLFSFSFSLLFSFRLSLLGRHISSGQGLLHMRNYGLVSLNKRTNRRNECIRRDMCSLCPGFIVPFRPVTSGPRLTFPLSEWAKLCSFAR